MSNTEALRAAAQEALDALESLQGGCTDSGDGTVEAITVWCPEVIDALRAALAQPAASGEPVAYWIPKAEQFCIAEPGERPFASAWQPLYANAQPAPVSGEPLTADQESRCVFLARLENMQQNGHTWLTIQAVLALLNDCDMLASGHCGPPAGPATAQPAPARAPLTEAQIAAIVREASAGSAIRRDGSTSQRIARAIEAAHGITAKE